MVSDKALQAFMLQPNLTYGEPGRSASLAVPAEATLPLALGWKETRHIAWLEVQFWQLDFYFPGLPYENYSVPHSNLDTATTCQSQESSPTVLSY